MNDDIFTQTAAKSGSIANLSELNEPQYKAVTTTEGPVLVIAGAGSGKTRTLVYRVAHLVEKGVPAERVAGDTATEVKQYLGAGVPVGRQLADQLLVPMAVAGGGMFRTLALTPHSTTNIEVIKEFLAVDISATSGGKAEWTVRIGS